MNKHANAYRKRHKKLGLCSDCPRKARKGKKHCLRCAKRSRAKWHRLQRQLRRLRNQLLIAAPKTAQPRRPRSRK